MSDFIRIPKGVDLYIIDKGSIEGGGFEKPTRQEEYENHWEDDQKAARGCFGWPLIIGCILTSLIVVGVSYWLDTSF